MQPLTAQPPSKTDYLSIAQLSVSGLSLVLSLLVAISLVIFGVIGLMRGTDLASISSLFSMVWISLLFAALAVPSLIYSIQRLGGRSPALPEVRSFRMANFLIFVWPLVLLLGNAVSGQPRLAWLFLPPLQLLAVGLPVWWLVEMIRHRLPIKSRQRGWGLVNFSIFITTPLLMLVEILFLLAVILLFAVWVSSQPDLMRLLERLAQRLINAPASPEAVLEIIRPYLQNPLLIFGVLAVVAGLVPLIEELFKPLAVWALAGRQLTPAEGFVAGGMCGAAFGLVESLFYLSNPLGDGWALLAVGRAGTALLHIVTSALVGWAMAGAWRNGSYLKLALGYLLAVFLHGVWNGLNILMGFNGALNTTDNLSSLAGLGRIAPLAVLTLLMFVLLWAGSSYLQRREALAPETILTDPFPQSVEDAENRNQS